MVKKIKFYNFHEGDKICEGILEDDPLFWGGKKVLYQNMVLSINLVKKIEKGGE